MTSRNWFRSASPSNITAIMGAAWALIVSSAAVPAGELTDTEFRQLRAELEPDPTELWRTVPWKIALLDAQQTAARENKPLFIWAMDGHPLGCT